MNHALRTTLAIAVLSTLAPSQHGTAAAADPRLTRLQVIEEQEGDLRAAETGYRALLAASDAVALHAEASLRLGALLWRLDRRDDATPFLQAAVAGGGTTGDAATKILQGQGDSDKAAQERLVRARALTARLDQLLMSERHSQVPLSPAQQEELTKAMAATTKELTFLGDAAATALVERLRELRRASHSSAAVDKDGRVVGLAGRLWRIGTGPARQYLAEVAADPMVEWRRAIAAPCQSAAEDMVSAAEAFLRDNDPTGDVANSMDPLAHRLPIAQLTRYVTDGNAQVRAFGWDGIADQLQRLPAPEQDTVLTAVGDRFVAAATGDDLRARASAAQLGRALVQIGTPASQRLVLRLFAKGGDCGHIDNGKARSFQLDDDAVAELAAAGRALGPCPTLSKGIGHSPAASIATILEQHDPQWKEAGVASIVELVELGYARLEGGNDARWPSRLASFANESDLGRLVRALPRVAAPKQILHALERGTRVRVPWTAAREAFEAGIRGATTGWRISETPTTRLGQVEAPSYEARSLLSLVGESGDPAAAGWLSAIAQQSPLHADNVATALVVLSIATGAEAVRVAMRTLLAATDPAGKALTPPKRGILLFELVRLGDAPAIPLLPRALVLGVGESSHPSDFLDAAPGVPIPTRHPLAGLGEFNEGPRHGYDESHWVAAWRSLFAGAPTQVVDYLVPSSCTLPPAALADLVRRLPKEGTDMEATKRQYRLSAATSSLRAARTADVAPTSDLRRAIAETIAGPDDLAALVVIDHLHDDVLRVVADDVRARMRTIAEPGEVLARLLRCGIALSIDEWRVVLRGDSWRAALASLPAKPEPALEAEVTAMLASNDTERRERACSTLACWMNETSVAPLLNALRDPAKEVRAAAADALQRIRFHREQDAFWSGAEHRVDTSTAGAAAKLIGQARPAAPREQRLLAIRSLGTLGAAEALPYLIEWTGDTDAEVTAASRAAIEAIQKKADTTK